LAVRTAFTKDISRRNASRAHGSILDAGNNFILCAKIFGSFASGTTESLVEFWGFTNLANWDIRKACR